MCPMNSNMDKITSWLLEGQPWITYRTRLDLLNQSPDDTEVKRCKEQMRKHPWIQQILQELKEWPGSVMKNHKQASHLLHKLAFIAELDFSMEDADISAIVKKILLHASPEGPFEILTISLSVSAAAVKTVMPGHFVIPPLSPMRYFVLAFRIIIW